MRGWPVEDDALRAFSTAEGRLEVDRPLAKTGRYVNFSGGARVDAGNKRELAGNAP